MEIYHNMGYSVLMHSNLLALFKETAMQDESYRRRLQTHYALAKKKQGAKV